MPRLLDFFQQRIQRLSRFTDRIQSQAELLAHLRVPKRTQRSATADAVQPSIGSAVGLCRIESHRLCVAPEHCTADVSNYQDRLGRFLALDALHELLQLSGRNLGLEFGDGNPSDLVRIRFGDLERTNAVNMRLPHATLWADEVGNVHHASYPR
jgi:hypothetical protein